MSARKRITPQWVSPLAWSGPNPAEKPLRQTYIQTQETLYLNEYSLLSHMESTILELANGIHHYAFRNLPDPNDDFFHDDMTLNTTKKQRVLYILNSIVSFQQILQMELGYDEEQVEETNDEETINEDSTDIDSTECGSVDDQQHTIVMSVISHILDTLDEEETV